MTATVKMFLMMSALIMTVIRLPHMIMSLIIPITEKSDRLTGYTETYQF